MEVIKSGVNKLLSLLIAHYGRNLKNVTELDGFDFKHELKARNLGVNSEFFKNNKGPLIIGDEPIDRISTLSPTTFGTPPYVASIKNVYLFGLSHPIAVTAGFKIISDTIENKDLLFTGRVDSVLKSGIDFRSKLILLFKTNNLFGGSKKKVLREAVLLTNNWTHFGHWILEHVLKVRYVQEFQRKVNSNPIYILEKGAPQWQYEILGLLGVKKEDTVCWEGKPVLVKKLVLPSYPEWNYDDYNWLRETIFKNLTRSSKQYPSRIYLSRKNCTTRVVENEEALSGILAKYDIQIIYPEELSIIDQIELFSQVTFVMGANGSAFTNIIFSKDISVIEFHGLEVRRTAFRLSKMMGFTYYAFYTELNEAVSNNQVDRYLIVDLIKLNNLLNDVLG